MANDVERKLVVLEDGLLVTMSNDPRYVSQFPFLASLAGQARETGKKGGCNSCANKSDSRRRLLNAAKAALANMAGENRNKLKAMLNTGKLRVRYLDGNKTIEKTF